MTTSLDNPRASPAGDVFNAQRARFKEIYVQKENECKQKQHIINDLRSKLHIAEYERQKDLEEQKLRSEQEIQTFQQIVQEALDESGRADDEIVRLCSENDKLRQEILGLKEILVQQQQQVTFYCPHQLPKFKSFFFVRRRTKVSTHC